MKITEVTRPNLFIVGAPKCGTTAMAKYLSDHAQVFFSDPKEPYFWAEDLPLLRARYGTTTLARYLALFAKATPQHAAVGEGSTVYLYSSEAIPGIMQFAPSAKIVCMLRHPVDLAHAFHMQMRFHFFEDQPDFEAAWLLQEARARGDSAVCEGVDRQLFQYREVARLGRQVDRLLRTVPRKQVLFVLFDDFKRSTGEEYRRVLEFLGLKDDGRSEFSTANEAMVARNRLLTGIIRSRPSAALGRGLKRVLRGRAYNLAASTKKWLFSKPQARVPVRLAFRRQIIFELADDIHLLGDCLNHDLSEWLM